jgi:ADP-heptose:LPS heptosyltransferase
MRASDLPKRILEYGVLSFASVGWTLLSRLRPRRIELDSVRNVLLIPHPGIGNLILLTPALLAIRQKLPATRISVVVDESGCAEVLRTLPELVQEVLFFDFTRLSFGSLRRFLAQHRSKVFDLSFSCWGFPHGLLAWLLGARRRIGFQYKLGFHRCSSFLLTTGVSFNHCKHEVNQYLDLLKPVGIEVASPEIFFPQSGEDDERVEALLRAEVSESDIRHLVGLHIGSNDNLMAKRWPPESFASLITRIRSEFPSVSFVLVGGKNEVPYAQRFVARCHEAIINFVGRLELQQTAALIRRCALFISNDTGPMHIAAAVKTPVIGIFGPTVHWKNAPWGDPHQCIVVRKDLPCSPCYVPYSARIACTDPRCLRDLTVDEVYEKAKPILRERCYA